MELMEIVIPALIISAVGIMVGTRIWMVFRK
jgi:hypothetical protein